MNSLSDWDAWKHISARIGREWYQISNKADVAEVFIYGEVGYEGVTAEDLIVDLSAIESPEIRVRINSPGGSVIGGIAIYNALREHPATVTTRVESMAGSIASVIAQAGDVRRMMQHSQMIIHNAHSIVIGESKDLREFADFLDKQSDIIADIYAERSGKPRSIFASLMSATTHFTAEETVSAGLADEVWTPQRKTSDGGEGAAAATTVDPSNDLEEAPAADRDTPTPPKSVKFGDLFERNPFADLNL